MTEFRVQSLFELTNSKPTKLALLNKPCLASSVHYD